MEEVPDNILSSRRVLVVEDNDDLRRELIRELGARGWTVDAARTLHEALDLVRHTPPNAIVTELVLPDVRDYRFAPQLRRALPANVPIVALTRLSSVLFELARRAGFDDVIAKPGSIDEIHRSLAR